MTAIIKFLIKTKTTQRYTHAANTTKQQIQSPLDRLNFEENENNRNKPP